MIKHLSGFLIVILLGCAIISSCRPKEKVKDADAFPYDSFEIMRGTNIAHWLSQSQRRGPERESFFTEKDVKFIDSCGFDHIRLPIDEEQMWDESGNRYEDAFSST